MDVQWGRSVDRSRSLRCCPGGFLTLHLQPLSGIINPITRGDVVPPARYPGTGGWHVNSRGPADPAMPWPHVRCRLDLCAAPSALQDMLATVFWHVDRRRKFGYIWYVMACIYMSYTIYMICYLIVGQVRYLIVEQVQYTPAHRYSSYIFNKQFNKNMSVVNMLPRIMQRISFIDEIWWNGIPSHQDSLQDRR